MQTNEQIFQRVTKRIRQLDARRVRILKHFTTRRRGRLWIVDCWCGVSWATAMLDIIEVEENLMPWINDHAACPPKEHS